MYKCRGGLAQSVECDVRNVEAEGSKPSFSTFSYFSFKFRNANVAHMYGNMYSK